MSVSHGEKLYGLPGPQNSAVLMDIISKLKQELQQSRADNNKLVDQLNCLIALVKRAWSGEQGAILHLANIVGVEAPNMASPEMTRNTPVPEKSRAVKNWEKMAIKLLEREYNAVQHEIKQKQHMYLQHRQAYINDVMQDHNQEMSKYHLHKKTTVEDVDRQFIRCFSAKSRSSQSNSAGSRRPHSAFHGRPPRVADMVDRAQISMGDLIGQHPSKATLQQCNQGQAFNSLYRLSGKAGEPYKPKEHFDDPNRYKQNNLFDPDVIFSPELMSKDKKQRPGSASSGQDNRTNLRTRPKSAVFLTEGKPERPLKYETTRPVSGKGHVPGASLLKARNKSAPSRRPMSGTIKQKELHNRAEEPAVGTGSSEDHGDHERNGEEFQPSDASQMSEDHDIDVGVGEEEVHEKPPIKVKVGRSDSVNEFVEELKIMNKMEEDFKKSAFQLQKKLGIETAGFVY